MRGEHIVIGGDHSDIDRMGARDGLLVLARCGKCVRQIAARKRASSRAGIPLTVNEGEIGVASPLRTVGNTGSNGFDDRVHARSLRDVWEMP